jgi:hypothetical protein
MEGFDFFMVWFQSWWHKNRRNRELVRSPTGTEAPHSCPICLNALPGDQNLLVLPCPAQGDYRIQQWKADLDAGKSLHVFHAPCAAGWAQGLRQQNETRRQLGFSQDSKFTCPLCRRPYPGLLDALSPVPVPSEWPQPDSVSFLARGPDRAPTVAGEFLERARYFAVMTYYVPRALYQIFRANASKGASVGQALSITLVCGLVGAAWTIGNCTTRTDRRLMTYVARDFVSDDQDSNEPLLLA